MRYAHTVEQVRAAEAALTATLPDGALMQRAAAGLATACADLLGRVYGARILLLVGSGSNGGDALFAGARLQARGARVEALLLSPRAHEAGLSAFLDAGGRVVVEPGTPDLVVDAIVGIGGAGGLRDEAAAVVSSLTAPVVAVDIPSGVDVDSGETAGEHVVADLTVTFGTHKVGLLVGPAARAAGVVELIDIGLGPYLPSPVVESLQTADVRDLLPVPGPDAHKYTRGVLGVLAGSDEYAGAAVLVTSAAVSAGFSGMVRYEGSAADQVRRQLPEVVGPGRVQAWVVGPGLGQDRGDDVARVLSEGLPTVVDADALAFLPRYFTSPAVLTPHAGELARMLECERDSVEAEMLRAATTAARRWNAVVVLKGTRSVIAAPDGRVRVNTTGVAWLATAGAGDVLAGVIGSLLAAGLDTYQAASVGAWLHGSAAALASRGDRDAGAPVSATAVVSALRETIRRTLG